MNIVSYKLKKSSHFQHQSKHAWTLVVVHWLPKILEMLFNGTKRMSLIILLDLNDHFKLHMVGNTSLLRLRMRFCLANFKQGSNSL